MTTRREFMGYLPAAGAAFAISRNMLLGEGSARLPRMPRRRSKDTSTRRARRRRNSRSRSLQQAKRDPPVRRPARLRGTEARLHRADARPQDHGRRRPRRLGHGALPVPQRGPRLRQHPPVAAPPVAAQQQLRPLRGDPRHLPGARRRPLRPHLRPRQDRLDRLRPAGQRRAGPRRLEALPEACRRRPAGDRGDLLPHSWRPLGRRARPDRRGGCALGQGGADRAGRLHGLHHLRERLCRQRHEPPAVLPVWPAPAGEPARLCRPGPRTGRLGRRHRADRAEPPRLRGRSRSSRSTASG